MCIKKDKENEFKTRLDSNVFCIFSGASRRNQECIAENMGEWGYSHYGENRK